MGKGQQEGRVSGYAQFNEVLLGVLPQFAALCQWGNEDFISFTVRHRGADDFVAVIKAIDDDGGEVVCFGNGFDLVSALLGIEGTLAADRWQMDKPFNSE